MKNKSKGLLILLISLVGLTTVLFVIPIKKSPAFFISFAFMVVAFAAQILIWNIGFENGKLLKSKYTGLPVIYIGTIYLTIQSVATFVLCFVPIQGWISFIVSLLILGIFSTLIITAQIAKRAVDRMEEKIESKVNFIHSIQCDIELLADTESELETKKALEALAEKIRFSDPMSSNQLKQIEEKIIKKTNELKFSTEKAFIIVEIDALLAERNKKCKNLKRSD